MKRKPSGCPRIPHGKIGQLPQALREELSRRLLDNEKGSTLLAWINAQPQAREVLERNFHGKPITAQNLLDWKRHAAYQHWAKEEQALRERFAPLARARNAMESAKAALPIAPEMEGPMVVEKAECQSGAGGLPFLALVVNGVSAQVEGISTAWLSRNVVVMKGGPPHSAPVLGGNKIKNLTDDPVVIEMARRLLFDWREDRLFTGLREIPSIEEARAARWEIDAKKDTISQREAMRSK